MLDHLKTGAKHIHLDSPDNENAFAVLFRTPPGSDSGEAHILEHMALCGSDKFPIRDPFFNMLKRSLNTYMNAWTGSDFTMYPFASCNEKDYQNLLSVYLDAAFFPLLNKDDFDQEGMRLDFSSKEDPESELLFKGVVYNEMKGANASIDGMFVQATQSHLMKGTSYKFNSGGDFTIEPKETPKQMFKRIKEFHGRYYHPSNATFLTYGDLDLSKHLQMIDESVL